MCAAEAYILSFRLMDLEPQPKAVIDNPCDMKTSQQITECHPVVNVPLGLSWFAHSYAKKLHLQELKF